MIKPDELDSDRPYGSWGFRGHDIWEMLRAAADGEVETLEALLARDRNLVRAEYWYTRPIHLAVREGHIDAVRVLLDSGADPAAEDLAGDDLITTARDRGFQAVAKLLAAALAGRQPGAVRVEPPAHAAASALYAAASAGDLARVEALLDAGADPNYELESSGNATFAAKTPELRALLIARGGSLDPYDLIWLGEDDEAVRLVEADPRSADRGCGGALAAACKLGRRVLVERLLAAGARVAPVVTGCRSYLLTDPELLRLLLASGMDPDLPDWQHARPLHDLCGRDTRGRPRPHRRECAAILLDAGAAISPRDEHYRSTPLGWAARCGLPDMVELLLARGAPVALADDPPWATPLAWARRRGHRDVVEVLRRES